MNKDESTNGDGAVAKQGAAGYSAKAAINNPTATGKSGPTVPVPADAVMLRKIAPPAGIHPPLGYMAPGWAKTASLPDAARVLDSHPAEYEPFSDEDARKIERYRAEQSAKKGGK